MLTAHPDLVSMAEAVRAPMDCPSRYFQQDYRVPQRVYVARTMDQGTTAGAYGQSELASLEQGRATLDAAATAPCGF